MVTLWCALPVPGRPCVSREICSEWALDNPGRERRHVGTDTNSSTNAVALGQQVGTFLNKAGPHDILFNNPLDRDAGQYQAVFGQNRWWDRQNMMFPNFRRWEQYLQASSGADGGKSFLLSGRSPR